MLCVCSAYVVRRKSSWSQHQWRSTASKANKTCELCMTSYRSIPLSVSPNYPLQYWFPCKVWIKEMFVSGVFWSFHSVDLRSIWRSFPFWTLFSLSVSVSFYVHLSLMCSYTEFLQDYQGCLSVSTGYIYPLQVILAKCYTSRNVPTALH